MLHATVIYKEETGECEGKILCVYVMIMMLSLKR